MGVPQIKTIGVPQFCVGVPTLIDCTESSRTDALRRPRLARTVENPTELRGTAGKRLLPAIKMLISDWYVDGARHIDARDHGARLAARCVAPLQPSWRSRYVVGGGAVFASSDRPQGSPRSFNWRPHDRRRRSARLRSVPVLARARSCSGGVARRRCGSNASNVFSRHGDYLGI
jgi:hypothetical protein